MYAWDGESGAKYFVWCLAFVLAVSLVSLVTHLAVRYAPWFLTCFVMVGVLMPVVAGVGILVK